VSPSKETSKLTFRSRSLGLDRPPAHCIRDHLCSVRSYAVAQSGTASHWHWTQCHPQGPVYGHPGFPIFWLLAANRTCLGEAVVGDTNPILHRSTGTATWAAGNTSFPNYGASSSREPCYMLPDISSMYVGLDRRADPSLPCLDLLY
jgi:hypothetical protein